VSRVAFHLYLTTQGSGDCAKNHREGCCSGADRASLGGFLPGIARLASRVCGSVLCACAAA
jgi:hypothetical protein